MLSTLSSNNYWSPSGLVDRIVSPIRSGIERLLDFARLTDPKHRHLGKELISSVCLTAGVYAVTALLTKKLFPFSVVLSGSMEPTMYRGDFLIVSRRVKYNVGDVVVFTLQPLDNHLTQNNSNLSNATPTPAPEVEAKTYTPIVHRIVEINQDADGKQLAVTKGDNNKLPDVVLYPPPHRAIPLDDASGVVQGKVIFRLPLVGQLSVLAEENGGLKTRLALVSGLMAVAYWYDLKFGEASTK